MELELRKQLCESLRNSESLLGLPADVGDRGRKDRLGSVPPPSEPDVRFSRIRLSG